MSKLTRDSVRDSLERHLPHYRILHGAILDGLHADNLFSDVDEVSAGRLEALEASRQQSMNAVREQAFGELRRLEIEPKEKMSLAEINAAMSAKGLSPQKRIAVKALLAAARVID
jgi:hypothetical protein